MINDYLDGEIKMIDIFSFNKSLKATWIKKFLDVNNKGCYRKHSLIWNFINLVET